MELILAVLLGLVQGITEFLPISSSAHLLLPSRFFGMEQLGLGFDLAVHSGSLIAVLWHYRQRLQTLLAALRASITGGDGGAEAALARNLIVASLPLLISGPIIMLLDGGALRGAFVIAGATLVFGVVLLFADRRPGIRTEYELDTRQALIIGLAQVLAVIPGVSRSGITITASRWLGLNREAAASFSFLLAIPIIGAISVALLFDTVYSWDLIACATVDPFMALIGFSVSAIFSLLTIRLFLRLVERIGLLPFALYRMVLGSALLVYLFAFAP